MKDPIRALPDPKSFPDLPHFATGKNIRATIEKVFKIHGIRLTTDDGISPADAGLVLGSLNELLARVRKAQVKVQVARALAASMWDRIEPIVRAKDVIGRGASAVVYKGVLDGKPVAVKTLASNATPLEAKQFDNEASLMLSHGLSHPNVLTCLLSLKRPSGEHYLVLPLCGQGSLKDPSPAARDQLALGRVRLRILLGVADGLSYLHVPYHILLLLSSL